MCIFNINIYQVAAEAGWLLLGIAMHLILVTCKDAWDIGTGSGKSEVLPSTALVGFEKVKSDTFLVG